VAGQQRRASQQPTLQARTTTPRSAINYQTSGPEKSEEVTDEQISIFKLLLQGMRYGRAILYRIRFGGCIVGGEPCENIAANIGVTFGLKCCYQICEHGRAVANADDAAASCQFGFRLPIDFSYGAAARNDASKRGISIPIYYRHLQSPIC
jgi:hypothetical protein